MERGRWRWRETSLNSPHAWVRELYTPDDFIQYTREAWEFRVISVHNISKVQKKMVKYTEVRDLEGLGWKHLWKRGIDLVRVMVSEGSQNYSETLQRVIIINAPWVFKLGWAILEPLLHPRTLRKIQILGSDYQKDLHQYIPRESLPRRYGGLREDSECLPLLVLGYEPKGVIEQATAATKTVLATTGEEVEMAAGKLVVEEMEEDTQDGNIMTRRPSIIGLTRGPSTRKVDTNLEVELVDGSLPPYGAVRDWGGGGGNSGGVPSAMQLLQISLIPIAMVALISAQLSYGLAFTSPRENGALLLGAVDLVFIVAVTSVTTAIIVVLSAAGASFWWRGLCCLSAAYLAARSYDDGVGALMGMS